MQFLPHFLAKCNFAASSLARILAFPKAVVAFPTGSAIDKPLTHLAISSIASSKSRFLRQLFSLSCACAARIAAISGFNSLLAFCLGRVTGVFAFLFLFVRLGSTSTASLLGL
mmetsp:Transcript_5663/g.15357  ORF Transcript_5663/g.15357 Transcript_5663/m.15357 type:complete len:113 (-) Transcript_5663:354-692(-)